MDLELKEIRTLDEGRYTAIFLNSQGATESVTCTIIQHPKATGVRFDPDIFMLNQPPRADSKKVVTAVLAYHRQKTISPSSRHGVSGGPA